MRSLARTVLSVLILAFAAGTFLQAKAMAHSSMDLPMAMSQDGNHISGCDDRSSEPNDIACFVACTAPGLAVTSPVLTLATVVGVPLQPAVAWPMVGEPRAPDPYPPRPSFLT